MVARYVVMETSKGAIKLELDEDKAPVTVKNFLSYVDDRFYDGTIFHRVIRDFMIQGGGHTPGMGRKATKAPIRNESGNGLSNVRGTIAMARTTEPDSATAQFFINVADNSASLDRGRYCVFGRVTEGMDVVDQIRGVRTGTRAGHDDVPVEDVLIHSVRRTCGLLGNPFRPRALDRTWLTPDVRALAKAASDEHVPPEGPLDGARLALLADALEDAGCTDQEILGHLRGEGPHVRECCVVNLLLGREPVES